MVHWPWGSRGGWPTFHSLRRAHFPWHILTQFNLIALALRDPRRAMHMSCFIRPTPSHSIASRSNAGGSYQAW
jgi:hypothetical protein